MKTTIQLLTLSTLISAFSLQPSAFGQGTALTYQGRLTDGGPNANGAYDFTFQLFDAANGGASQSAPLSTNAVPLADGLFTVALDFGATPFSAGAARWLEIKVRTNGAGAFGTIVPRQQVTATPYAIVAGAVTGPVSSTSLTGNYSNTVNFANGANSFSGSFAGDGAGITNLNPALLNGLVNSNSWQLGGNAGTTPGLQILGTTDDQPLELVVNGRRALRIQPFSTNANLIGGFASNFVGSAVTGATIGGGGAPNTVQTILNITSTITNVNRVTADFGTVCGGLGNLASGYSSTAIGYGSTASGFSSTAVGYSSVASGYSSTAFGQGNTASGESALSLGRLTSASGLASFAAGSGTIASGDFSTAIGSGAQATNRGCFVWADASSSAHFSSSSSNQFLIRASGGVGVNTTTPVADLHVNGNVVVQRPEQVPVSASSSNLLNLLVGGGSSPVATNGSLNGISFYEIPAAAAMSLGYDGSGGGAANALRIYKSDGSPLFTFEASGDLGIGTNAPQQKLHVIGNILASGTITGSSDRNVKERFAPVNPREVLEKVSSLPITEWSYKADDGVRHLGPMAQDFYSAFAVGMDDKHISMVDADGVALAAIQGLNQKLEETRSENAALKARLERLEKLLAHSYHQ